MNLCYISLYATHFIVTDKLTKAVDSIILGIIQLGFAGALGLVFSLFFEIPRFPITTQEWLPILVLSILCSAIGFIVQTVAQQHTTSTNTGLIFSLEPVFASIFAFLVLDEILSTQGLVGAMLVLLGVIYSQVNWKRGNNSLASKLYTPQNKMMLQNVPSKSHVMNCLKSSHQSTVFFQTLATRQFLTPVVTALFISYIIYTNILLLVTG